MPQERMPIRVDAMTFQEPLARLADVRVEKVFRESAAQCGWPGCVSEDVSMMLRYSMSVYNLVEEVEGVSGAGSTRR